VVWRVIITVIIHAIITGRMVMWGLLLLVVTKTEQTTRVHKRVSELE
jgi:hypothetical protein